MIDLEKVAEVNRNVSWTLLNTDKFASETYSLSTAVFYRLGFIFQPIMDCISKHNRRYSADLMYDVFQLAKTAQEYDEGIIKNGMHELMLVGIREFGVDSEGSIFYAMSPDSCLGDVEKRYKGLFRLTFEKNGCEFTFYLWKGEYSPVKVVE